MRKPETGREFLIAMVVVLVFASTLGMVSGCTHNPSSHTQNTTYSPRREHRLYGGGSLYIDKGFFVSKPAGLLHGPFDHGLVEGRYTAELRDGHGTYYRGPRQCVYLNVENDAATSWRREGGLYIPTNAGADGTDGAEPVVYYYLNSDSKADGSSVPVSMDATHPYVQGQMASAGSTGGVVGSALGGAIVGGIVSGLNGTISFIPMIETKGLMPLVRHEAVENQGEGEER